jgi:hypothetical protein
MEPYTKRKYTKRIEGDYTPNVSFHDTTAYPKFTLEEYRNTIMYEQSQ